MVFLDWISNQLTVLAEAFAEDLRPERAEIYVIQLSDIPRDRLQVAFQRALTESKWFPKIAELRDWSGFSPETQKSIEAQEAWVHVNNYLRKWGVDRMPIRSDGKWITAPPLEPRLEYALRQIGGLWRLNQVTDENYPFVYKDFCEAYTRAPVAELMGPELLAQFSPRSLEGNVKKLMEAGVRHALVDHREIEKATPATSSRDALTTERRADLRRKLDEELAKRR